MSDASQPKQPANPARSAATSPAGQPDPASPRHPTTASAAPEGAAKPQRPATLTFTQAVLGLQALAALFATLAAWGLSRTTEVSLSVGWIWGGGLLLMVALIYVAGKQKQTWGRIAGWVLQVPMILAGLIVPAIAAIGVMFLVLWIMGLRIGGRIDRERAERLETESSATVGDTPRGDVTPNEGAVQDGPRPTSNGADATGE